MDELFSSVAFIDLGRLERIMAEVRTPANIVQIQRLSDRRCEGDEDQYPLRIRTLRREALVELIYWRR